MIWTKPYYQPTSANVGISMEMLEPLCWLVEEPWSHITVCCGPEHTRPVALHTWEVIHTCQTGLIHILNYLDYN
jgi:hypothetical protein